MPLIHRKPTKTIDPPKWAASSHAGAAKARSPARQQWSIPGLVMPSAQWPAGSGP